MNRRDLLQTLASAAALPMLPAAPDSDTSKDGRLTYSKQGQIDGRVSQVQRHLVDLHGRKRARWSIDVDGEEVFEEEYPVCRLGEHHYGDTIMLRFYESELLEEALGAVMFSVNNQYAYHKHPIGGELRTYAQDLIEDEYEVV